MLRSTMDDLTGVEYVPLSENGVFGQSLVVVVGSASATELASNGLCL